MFTQEHLANFYGTAEYHACTPLVAGLKYTDGVKFVETNGAGWLVDKIAILCTHEDRVRKELRDGGFLVAKLTKKSDGSASFVIEDGDLKAIYKETISYTDIEVDNIKFFITDGVVMLSSEY